MLIGCNKQEEEKIADNKFEETEELIQLSSNDKRLVFQDGENYKVFNYEEDKITGYKNYMNYKTIESARNTVDIIKVNYSNDEDIKEVTREAQFIVITYNDDYIKNNFTTIDELRKSLSSLKEIK